MPADNPHGTSYSQRSPSQNPGQPAKPNGQHTTGQPTAGAPTNNGQPDTDSVPIWFRAISVWLGLVGLFACWVGLLSIQASESASRYAGSGTGTGMVLIGITALAFGGASLLAAYRTWIFHPDGWQLAVWLLAAGGALSFFLFTSSGAGSSLLGALLYGGLAWYLYSNEPTYRKYQRQDASTNTTPPGGHQPSQPPHEL